VGSARAVDRQRQRRAGRGAHVGRSRARDGRRGPRPTPTERAGWCGRRAGRL